MSKIKVTTAELNQVIYIGSILEDDTDDYGFPIKGGFSKEFKMYAKVMLANYSNNDFYEACSEQRQRDLKIITRYTDKIKYNHTLQFEGDNYKIEGLENVEYANEWLVIRASILVKDMK